MNTTKKFMTLLLAVLAMYSLTACDEDVKYEPQRFTLVINNRACKDGVVIFSQGKVEGEIDYKNSTIKFTGTYKDINGQARTLITPEIKMPSSHGAPVRVYSFSTNDGLSDGVKNLSGSLDNQTGMMRYTFQQDDYTMVCTTHPLFNNVITSIIDVTGATLRTNNSAYLFMLDRDAKTCEMQISNFIPGVNGMGQVEVVAYKDLDVTITSQGYIIKSDVAKSSLNDSYYDLTDVNVTIDNDCTHFSGSFKTKVSRHEFSGNLF